MKHTFFMLFVSIAISFMACEGGGENDENLPADNGIRRNERMMKPKSLWSVASHL